MNRREPWRLLITPPLPAASNMALDHALLESYAATHRPALRFYRWHPAAVSIGVGQRIERDVDRAACVARGIDVVRRITGGRAILHAAEITYSLVIAPDHPLLATSRVVESYRSISAALCAGLRRLGLDPEWKAHARAGTSSAACFDQPADYEITVGGRKLVGSAQARQYGALLQHGSLPLHADTETLAAVLRLPPDLTASVLAQRMIALDEALGFTPTFDTIVAALVAGFEHAWGIRVEPDVLTAAEQARTAVLVAARYNNPAWNARR
jgi:lipoyl(octanoyl) transferase